MEAGRDDGVDRLERDRLRHQDVAEELAGRRIGDDGALVADHRIVDPGLEDVRTDRAEHPARDDDHVDAGRAHRRDRGRGPRPQQRVRRDERPVEVRREGLDLAREVVRELDRSYGVPPVAVTTYDATSAICCAVSWPLNDGIGDFPRVTRAVARR